MTTKCKVKGCNRTGGTYKDYCPMHYKRIKIHGDPNICTKQKNPYGWIDQNGYFVLSKRITGKTNVVEHRWVVEQHIGRKLFRHEHIHHINGNRIDNRLENLEIWSTLQPAGQRIRDKLNYAREILRLYLGDELIEQFDGSDK